MNLPTFFLGMIFVVIRLLMLRCHGTELMMSHHFQQGYQAFAHLYVGYLLGCWMKSPRPSWEGEEFKVWFWFMCFVEVFCATATAIVKHL